MYCDKSPSRRINHNEHVKHSKVGNPASFMHVC